MEGSLNVRKRTTFVMQYVVLEQLKNSEPAEAILKTFCCLHPNVDQQVLLCYAAFFSHWALIKQLMDSYNVYSDYKPLLAAVSSCNLRMVELLAGDYKLPVDERGIGVIQPLTGHVFRKEATALSLALRYDDVQMFIVLARHFSGEYETLLEYMQIYNAPNCCKLVQKTCVDIRCNGYFYPDKHLILKLSNSHPLEWLMATVSNKNGKMTELQARNALQLWKRFAKEVNLLNSSVRRFLRCKDQNFVKSLKNTAKRTVHIYYCMLEKISPKLEGLSTDDQLQDAMVCELGFYPRLILDACQMVLVKEPCKIKCDIFCDLIYKVSHLIKSSHDAEKKDAGFLVQSMVLLNLMAKLVLQHGVEESPTRRLMFLIHEINVVPNEAQKQLFPWVHKFIAILLAYRYEKITESVAVELADLKIRSEHLSGTVAMCLSLATHCAWEAYRKKFRIDKELLEKEIQKPREERNAGKIEKLQIPVANGQNCKAVRSLQDIARLKLHETVPSGKLPVYLYSACQQLQLSNHTKLLISFGVKPLL